MQPLNVETRFHRNMQSSKAWDSRTYHVSQFPTYSTSQLHRSHTKKERGQIKTKINRQGEKSFCHIWCSGFHANSWLCNRISLAFSPLIMCTPGQGSCQAASDHPVFTFSFLTSSNPPPRFSFFHFLAPPHSDTGFHLLKQKLTVLLRTRSRASFSSRRGRKTNMCTPIPSVASRFTSASSTTLQLLHPAVGEPPHTHTHTHAYMRTRSPTGRVCLSASLPTTWWIKPRASNMTLRGWQRRSDPRRTCGPGRDALRSQLWTQTRTDALEMMFVPRSWGVLALMSTFYLRKSESTNQNDWSMESSVNVSEHKWFGAVGSDVRCRVLIRSLIPNGIGCRLVSRQRCATLDDVFFTLWARSVYWMEMSFRGCWFTSTNQSGPPWALVVVRAPSFTRSCPTQGYFNEIRLSSGVPHHQRAFNPERLDAERVQLRKASV